MSGRPGVGTLICLGAALALAGCSGDSAAVRSGAGTSSSAPASASVPAATPALPSPAGASEATALRPLPTGRASGSVLITYQGLGEIRSPFTGDCGHDGSRTEFRGSAGTARIVLTYGPDGASLNVDDVGLKSTAAVAAGTMDVHGGHVALRAPLVQGTQVIGTVQLDADCAV